MSWHPGVGGKREGEDEGMDPGHWPNKKGEAASLVGQGNGSVLTASPLPTSYPRASL